MICNRWSMICTMIFCYHVQICPITCKLLNCSNLLGMPISKRISLKKGYRMIPLSVARMGLEPMTLTLKV